MPITITGVGVLCATQKPCTGAHSFGRVTGRGARAAHGAGGLSMVERAGGSKTPSGYCRNRAGLVTLGWGRRLALFSLLPCVLS